MRRVALVTLLVLTPWPAAAEATFPGANGKIAFERDNDIWTMNADGSSQVNLTNNADYEAAPGWSADGTQIAYGRAGGVWVMNADGSSQHQVLPPPNDTTVCGPGGGFLGDGFGEPAWSPGSSKLVFEYEYVCSPFESEDVYFVLYTINPDGTGKALLRRGGRGPRWSPDGTKIGYTGVCDGGGCSVIEWTTPDGSQGGIPYSTNVDNEHFIDWSPDASLMGGGGEGGLGHPGFYSFTVHPDGTGYHEYPATFPPGAGVGRWSPDAQKFLYSGDIGHTGNIYTSNTDGSALTQIGSGAAADWQPIPLNYVRPKGASPFQTYLVPAYKACTAPNKTHRSALAFSSCSPPSQSSGQLTLGTPDANGQAANGRASVFLATRVGDLKVAVTIRDVRKADLADYTGQLDVQTDLRITDRNNTPAPGGPGAATVSDSPLHVPVSCTATGSATLGSDCNLTTTVNSLYPGAITAGQRAVWELGQVKAYDGGADGLASTSGDNTLFLTQGIFIP